MKDGILVRVPLQPGVEMQIANLLKQQKNSTELLGFYGTLLAYRDVYEKQFSGREVAPMKNHEEFLFLLDTHTMGIEIDEEEGFLDIAIEDPNN